MPVLPEERSNQAWLDALRADEGCDAPCAETLGELEAYLHRIVSRSIGRRVTKEDLPDLVQESLAEILRSLDAFRGDSRFTTWAAGVAIRVAYTELRRRKVRQSERDAFDVARDDALQLASTDTPPPDEAASRAQLLDALTRAIDSELTERQRVAVLAELRGVPTIEIAERLGTNQNALYKLTHDARRRLRDALQAAGFGADALHAAATEGLS